MRARVEKTSICAYRAAIEPVWYVKEGEAIDPALVERLRPLVIRFFDLCKKHGVRRTAEGSWHQIEEYEKRLRPPLGPWDRS